MRTVRTWLCLSLASSLLGACEDGPEQVFTPTDEDPTAANGLDDRASWVVEAGKSFGDQAGGDRQGRARFCDEGETDAIVREMVQEPMLPDQGLGGVPMWSPEGSALLADELLGRPEEMKFCDPSGVYSNAYTFGPAQEVIVLFNEETRLVEALIALPGYLGALSGEYTAADGTKKGVTIRPRDKVRVGDVELDQYSSRADQATRTRSWLNHANITNIHSMLRETFFGGEPAEPGFDCVEAKLCEVIYTGEAGGTADTVPQEALVVFRDSGVTLDILPDGSMSVVVLEPVRVAPFELASNVSFGDTSALVPRFTSESREDCTFSVGEGLTFAAFRDRCVQGEDAVLRRVNYDVAAMRDAVFLDFNGMTLGFLHPTSTGEPLADGAPPADGDRLYSFNFTRSLQAPLAEFVPLELALAYREKLRVHLRGALGTGTDAAHPFQNFEIPVADTLAGTPQPIGELVYQTASGPRSYVADVIAVVQDAYAAMPETQKTFVDASAMTPVRLLEPFVDAVLDAVSHGHAAEPGAFKAFRSTDDERWSIGYASFRVGGVPYRLVTQYSLNFGAVTSISVETGESDVDAVFSGLLEQLRASRLTTASYYSMDLAPSPDVNPYALNGEGIRVMSFDRRLDSVTVQLQAFGDRDKITLPVSGAPIEDRNGYLRQIRGERWEFVPANVVQLAGKETILTFYVEADGAIGRIDEALFKGSLELCGGLPIDYGTDVRAAVERWRAVSGREAYDRCGLVFNYSENGNVLDQVVSVENKRGVTVVAGRAVTASMWR